MEVFQCKKTMEICMYKSRTGARKLIDKMINADLIERSREKNNTFYKIKNSSVVTLNIE